MEKRVSSGKVKEESVLHNVSGRRSYYMLHAKFKFVDEITIKKLMFKMHIVSLLYMQPCQMGGKKWQYSSLTIT